MQEDINQVQAIEALVRAQQIHQPPGGIAFTVIPEGYRIHDLEKLQCQPQRIRETVALSTVEDFIAYGKQWADADSVIFADEASRKLTGLIDYHANAEAPEWASHQMAFTAVKSRELQAWEANNGKNLSQEGLAEFLEDRIGDVVEPSGASLLESALKLQIHKTSVFGSAIRLQNGNVQFNYTDNETKDSLVLPEKFALGIPLFHRGVGYRVEARLRYRLNGPGITFTYKLLELDRLIEHAFADVVKKTREGLPDVKLYSGSRVAAKAAD